jgi:hypothetical protein
LDILDLISKAKEAAAENWDSVGISIGALGSDCDRSLWYEQRWAAEKETFTADKLRIFEDGHHAEKQILDDLERTGILVAREDTDTGKQFKVFALGGHVRGKLDGEALIDHVAHVVEAKSHNDRSFKDLEKKGVLASKPAHYWQCQYYCHLRGRKAALYLAKNKNTSKLYAEIIPYDAVAVMRMEGRLANIINAPLAPERASENPEAFVCRFCKAKPVCHKEAFGRRNCRTCTASTPIITEGEDAVWKCELHECELPIEQQKVGCRDHLYHPDVVPGKQSDSGDDWIAYALVDGTQWVNGVQA